MRRFIPSMGKLDTSAVVLAYALTVVKMLLMLAIVGQSANVFGVLIIALRDLLNGVIWVYIIALILMAVISWIGSANGNPVVPLINSLTAPLLAPIRRVMPPVGMLDLSPMVAMLGLYILQIILSGLF